MADDDLIRWTESLLSGILWLVGEQEVDDDELVENLLSGILQLGCRFTALECAVGLLVAHGGLTDSLESVVREWQDEKATSSEEMNEDVVSGVDSAFDVILDVAKEHGGQ